MVNGCMSWPQAGRLIAAALLLGALAPIGAPPLDASRTLAERRVRPVQPAGPRYATGAAMISSPEVTAEAFDRLGELIGDWTLDGVFSPRPDLPNRDLTGRATIDWKLRGMQLCITIDQKIGGPETHLLQNESRDVFYLAWCERNACFDGVHMHSANSTRRWFAGEWDEDDNAITLLGAMLGESRDPESATVRLRLTRESDDRWRYQTAIRDPHTRKWLDRADAFLIREE